MTGRQGADGASRRLGIQHVAAATALAAVAAVAWVAGRTAGDPSPTTLILLSGVSVMTAALPVQFRFRGTVHGAHLGEAALVPLLFTQPAVVVPLVAGLSMGTVMVVQRRRPWQTVFGTAELALAGALAWMAFDAVGPAETVTAPRSLAAVLAATVVFNGVGVIVFGVGRQILTGRAFLTTWQEVRAVNAITWSGGTLLGIVLAVAALNEPAAVVAVAALLVALARGFRDHSAALEERARLEQLHAVARHLADALHAEEAARDFLATLARAFDASTAWLVVRGPAGLERRTWTSDTGMQRAVADPDDPLVVAAMQAATPVLLHAGDATPMAAVLHAAGHIDALLAGLYYDGSAVGAVAVLDQIGRRPWDDTDARLLGAVTSEAAVAVKNVELFESLEREHELLRLETARLADVVAAASDGIALIDHDRRARTWNPALATLTGVPADRAVDRDVLPIIAGAGDDQATVAAVIDQALEGSRATVDARITRPDQTSSWIRFSCAPVLRDAGDVAGAVLTARDITEERDLADLTTDFIATISHELRTPLTPLKGLAQTGLQHWEDLKPDDAHGLFQAMTRQLDRLEALVADLLLLADLDRGSLPLRTDPVDVARLARAAVDVECPRSERARVVVNGAPTATALTDPVATSRILRALVSNAIKHTAGRITVTVLADDHGTHVAIADEGAGIAPGDRGRAFARFGRLGSHLHRTQGPGLGLALASALAERLGGSLTLTSTPGTGSTFTLHIPAPDSSGPPTRVGGSLRRREGDSNPREP